VTLTKAILYTLLVAASDLNTITFTTAGGSQTVTSTTVTGMTRMKDTFYVEQEGSTLLLDTVIVNENQAQTTAWHAVSVRTGAIAQITECTISDNTALEYGVVAFDATISIADSFISRNSGTVRGQDGHFGRAEFDRQSPHTWSISHFRLLTIPVQPFLPLRMQRLTLIGSNSPKTVDSRYVADF
jgi:hypothetical protein